LKIIFVVSKLKFLGGVRMNEKLEARCGDHINGFAQRMIEAWEKKAILHKGDDELKVFGKFNDITLVCRRDTTAESIVKDYKTQSDAKAEAYRNSSEGKRVAREAEERKQKMQLQMDEVMAELPNLDFSDLDAIITWLGKAQGPSNHTGVKTPHKKIITTFRKYGFKANVNCGNHFNDEDKENFARMLIGQALDNLKCDVHAIHPIFHKFADDWRKKFKSVA